MYLILTVFVVFLMLMANEYWWQKHTVPNEFSRKSIHIAVGTYVAFWPFYLSWRDIEIMSLAFFVVVLLSKYLKVFQAIHSVQRPTWGELYFAAAVGSIALLTHDKYVYAAALLLMALADGLAAVVGIRYGGNHKYKIFGATKSVVGTVTFFVVALLILIGFSQISKENLDLGWIIIGSFGSAVIENIGVFGLDNILVPVGITLLLLHH